MTPRQLGIGMLCIGTLNVALGVVMLWRDAGDFLVVGTVIILSGAVLMGVGATIGRRTHWR